jgi:hypothetical protein
MFSSVSASFVVFLITLAIGIAGSFVPKIAVAAIAEFSQADFIGNGETLEDNVSSNGLRPCRNVDGVTLVRGDIIRVGDGRLKAYFALSNEGPLPIYYSSDRRRNLTEVLAYGSQINEVKPFELEWVLMPIPKSDQPFSATIGYRQGGFTSVRWLTASFSKTNRFPDACS